MQGLTINALRLTGHQLPVSRCEWYNNYKTKSNLDFGQKTWTRLLASSFSSHKAWASWPSDYFHDKKEKYVVININYLLPYIAHISPGVLFNIFYKHFSGLR